MIVARRLLFIHGAGGDLDDRPLAEEFAETLGMTLDYPVIPPDDMSRAAVIRPAVASLSASDVVIAHSFGASMLMQVLSDDPGIAVHAAVLLAMPDWSSDGWDIAEYDLRDRQPTVPLALHHCRDDEAVPVGHLKLNATRLPQARLYEHAVGGHQFDGEVGSVVGSLGRDLNAG
ncbi:alpha/beta hydrolase [Gordonia sp. ABSL49_1]|uniref:alpha/beta fold hydrolase n=1 Tax=Gordonia sp. NPDC003585 TaxID=3154275 RepID=UPI0023F1875F|nr:alpha/beta hydrolase [Gordonia sp. ABSL49_1]